MVELWIGASIVGIGWFSMALVVVACAVVGGRAEARLHHHEKERRLDGKGASDDRSGGMAEPKKHIHSAQVKQVI